MLSCIRASIWILFLHHIFFLRGTCLYSIPKAGLIVPVRTVRIIEGMVKDFTMDQMGDIMNYLEDPVLSQ